MSSLFCPNTHSKSLKVSLFAQLFGNPWNFATVDRRQFVISCKKSVFWMICDFLFEACDFASLVSALKVTKMGAQSSPTMEEVKKAGF